MGKLQKHWKSISVWRKAFYETLLGTFLWFLFGVVTIVVEILNNKTGIYQCAISVEKSCGLSEYILKSDSSIVFYISIVLIFILLLITTNIIYLLVYLYRKENKKLFWTILALVIITIITLTFLIQYLQDIL